MKNEDMVKPMNRSGDYRFTYIYHYLSFDTTYAELSSSYFDASGHGTLVTKFSFEYRELLKGPLYYAITITFAMSIMENLTNCYSTYMQLMCWEWYVHIFAFHSFDPRIKLRIYSGSKE